MATMMQRCGIAENIKEEMEGTLKNMKWKWIMAQIKK